MRLRDPEGLQRTPFLLGGLADDIVLLQQPDLVEREGSESVRQRRCEDSHQAREPEGNREIQPPTIRPLLNLVEQLAERENLRPADLVDRSRLGPAFDRIGDRCPEVAGVYWLKARSPAADERQEWADARHRGKPVEELVLRSKNDRGPDDNRVGEFLQDGLLGFRLGASVGRRAVQVGPDCGDVDESLRAGFARGLGNSPRSLDVDGIETLPPSGRQDADGIHDSEGILHRLRHRIRETDVGLNGMDLTEAAHGLQMPRQIRPAHGGANAPALSGQVLNRVAAHEPRSAEHGHQTAQGEVRGHAVSLLRPNLFPLASNTHPPRSCEVTQRN